MYQISIIIPTYNVENYIKKCIKSLIMQTSKNFEVIIVDDKSTDNTLKIIDKLKKYADFPINIFKNNKNLGAGETRNVGLQLCNYEYVMFLDADDYLEINCIESLNESLNYRKWDCICFDYYVNKRKIQTYSKSVNSKKIKLLPEEALIDCNGSVWCKLFRTEIIKDNHITFPSLIRNEDMVFTKKVISYCSEIKYIKQPLYHYVMRTTSLMHNKNLLNENNAIDGYKILCRDLDKKYKEVLKILFIKEVMYSMVVTLIVKRSKKNKLLRYISKLENYNSNWYDYVKARSYSMRIKLILYLIKHRKIYLLKTVIYLQEIGKVILR